MYSIRYSRHILMKTEYSRQIFVNIQISNFIKIRLVTAEVFHAEGGADRHDEANDRFP